MQERVFTQQELQEMGARTDDLLKKAIDNGETEQAKKLVSRMRGELKGMGDIATDMFTATLSFIGKRFGDDVLHEALHEALASWVRQAARDNAKVDSPRRMAQWLAYGFRGHGEPIKIEEDAEKFIFTRQPCGTGGRMILNGSYGPPRNFYRAKKPQLMTYGKSDFPAYCCHCIFHEIVGIEETGVPLFVALPADRPGVEPCQFFLYKDPKAIPAKYYERVGKQKPKW